MAIELKFDAKELEAIGQSLARLPMDIREKAFHRAMRRIRDTAKGRVIKATAERVNIQQKHVKSMTTARYNSGQAAIEIIEKAGWIPIERLGPVVDKSGTKVRFPNGKALFKSAFIGKMKSGVFRRSDVARLPIHELFGPNPAHDIVNNPDEYVEILSKIIEQYLAPRVLHEITQLMPK